MPNHCYQEVKIAGTTDIVRELYHGLVSNGYMNGKCKNPSFCSLVIPVPIETYVEKSDGLFPPWYNFCVKNWDTKWDVCDVVIVDDWKRQGNLAQFSFKCWTAWAPPVPIWERLNELGVLVEAVYEDEGGSFTGEYRDGEHTQWEAQHESVS